MPVQWEDYPVDGVHDELIGIDGMPRSAARQLSQYLASLTDQDLQERQAAAELAIRAMGITFTVYSEEGGIDRAWPFDIVPRVIASAEWRRVQAGLKQRVTALNCFINDIYGLQRIVKDKVLPAGLLADSGNFRSQCVGAVPRYGIWAHVCGTDLIRDLDGTIYVLEDNLRVPSGVSYMLQNRLVTKRVFPELFQNQHITPVDGYPSRLFDMLASLSPRQGHPPTVVVLTPGIYNSAYFEHSFLAQQAGAELVEGRDLLVADDDCVYLRTVDGLERVDVIYRRIDDLYLDPEVFHADSVIGVRGLMRAWRKGNVALANAPGAGVADDKVVYAFVPEMIRYYLSEEPIIANVPTYLCIDKRQCSHVLAHLDQMVVKPANESGGNGMLMGPQSTRKQRSEFAARIKKNPRNYVAQPTLRLSTAPTVCNGRLEPRHLDLRPFILSGGKGYVTPGGLTRVALKRGSLVVNSSQGGGSKDTWVVEDEGV